ncbi:hypothetical protein FM111_00765 [Brevundimonas diminuta 3F5N]|uniref:Uncharacterized protein n=1 Tax=Brevundimonas diminuta 3F5N TaxID=1255603 RepID=A0A1R4ETV3_BREDI|nr:hypothetical protein FM111_00765 [Brevundimonas diminuta 3F5N]
MSCRKGGGCGREDTQGGVASASRKAVPSDGETAHVQLHIQHPTVIKSASFAATSVLPPVAIGPQLEPQASLCD